MPWEMLAGFLTVWSQVTFRNGVSKAWKAQQEEQNFGQMSQKPFCLGIRERPGAWAGPAAPELQ